MRALIVVASFLLASLPHAEVAAQGGSCNAKPRWIVVTVVAGYTVSELETPTAWENLGARAVDRCAILEMFEINRLDQRFARGVGDEFVGAKAALRLHGGAGVSYELQISESVHDICAAVDDCANATGQSPAR